MSATVVEDRPATAQAPAPAAPAPAPMPPDKAIELYIRLRDKRDALAKEHAEQLKPYNEAMQRLEGLLLEALNKSGLENMKAAAGTAYKSLATSVTCNAWSQTLDYIRENEAWELLDARVNKTAAMSIITETKQGIPGVVMRQEVKVHVRRS